MGVDLSRFVWQHPLGGPEPPKSRHDGNGVGMRKHCAQSCTATASQTVKKLTGTAGFVWGHPQGGLRSLRDHRHSLRCGRFTPGPNYQAPECFRRNVAGWGKQQFLTVKLMVKFRGPKKSAFPKIIEKSEGTSSIQFRTSFQNSVSNETPYGSQRTFWKVLDTSVMDVPLQLR